MDPGIVIAIIATVVSPLLLAYATGRQRRKEKIEDWAREDLVAVKAQEAADRLLAAQEETIRRTDEVAIQAETTATETKESLKEIHTLVNSDMTAARQNELTVTKALLVLMQKNVQGDKDAGLPPSESDLAAIDATEVRILELQQILNDRHDAQARVNSERKATESKGVTT